MFILMEDPKNFVRNCLDCIRFIQERKMDQDKLCLPEFKIVCFLEIDT